MDVYVFETAKKKKFEEVMLINDVIILSKEKLTR